MIYREDISTSHEEADCIIVQQAMMASEYQQGVSVIADDTDVFILLIHHYLEQQLTNHLSMADLLWIYAELSKMKNK